MASDLQNRLGVSFNNHKLWELALTHKSFGTPNNERLEFLGDAVLGMVVANILFHKFEQVDEHELTLLRAKLVRGDTLAEVARENDLGPHLRIGVGEKRSGGIDRSSILADAMEAIIGAVYLDAGIDAATSVIARLWADRIEELDDQPIIDGKTRLQELLQSRQLDLPNYAIVQTSGEDHSKEFTVRCSVDSLKLSATAVATNRRAAEKAAAELVCEKLLEHDR